MKQEDKDLLLQDLCSRLPYGVKVFYEYVDSLNKKTYGYSLTLNTWCIDEMKAEKAVVKPYLRPMSSLTEEEIKEYKHLVAFSGSPNGAANFIDWLITNHFDYRFLIQMGLALDATGLNIY